MIWSIFNVRIIRTNVSSFFDYVYWNLLTLIRAISIVFISVLLYYILKQIKFYHRRARIIIWIEKYRNEKNCRIFCGFKMKRIRWKSEIYNTRK